MVIQAYEIQPLPDPLFHTSSSPLRLWPNKTEASIKLQPRDPSKSLATMQAYLPIINFKRILFFLISSKSVNIHMYLKFQYALSKYSIYLISTLVQCYSILQEIVELNCPMSYFSSMFSLIFLWIVSQN